jgi:hypothetical protein
MPGFIHTQADEEKWNAIKHSVAKQRGKKIDDFTDRDWATVNAAWHKSEVEEIKKSLTSMPGTKIPSGTKMPKPKSLPKPGDKPSLFFKKEDFGSKKHPSVENLRTFLEKRRSKK